MIIIKKVQYINAEVGHSPTISQIYINDLNLSSDVIHCFTDDSTLHSAGFLGLYYHWSILLMLGMKKVQYSLATSLCSSIFILMIYAIYPLILVCVSQMIVPSIALGTSIYYFFVHLIYLH